MISAGGWHRFCYKAGSIIQVGIPVLTTLFGVIATYPVSADFKSQHQIINFFYSAVHENLLFIFLVLFVAYLLSLWMRSYGDPWVLDKLQFVLDKYQNMAFVKNGAPAPTDYHRVTLFKYEKNMLFPRHWSAVGTWWPFGGGKHPFRSNYLRPILRSGRLSKKTNAIFHVSDSGDESEGVAGYAWVTEQAIVATGLPSIGNSPLKRDLQAYAESTMSEEAMIEAILAYKRSSRRSQPLPRAIVAIPVERNNRNWGVIVLDSRDPEGIAPNAVDNYRITIALIGLLLERL